MKTRRARWAYLLLGLGLEEGRTRQSHAPTALGWPTLRAQVIPFCFDRRCDNMIQLALKFHDGRADDGLAARIAEAIWGLHTLLGGHVLTDFGVVGYRIPGTLMRAGSCPGIPSAAVVEWDSRPFDERRGWEHDRRLTLRVGVAPIKSWTALHAVPSALQSPAFEALHLYQESVRKFAFLGDDLTQVMHVGETGDDERFRQRLVDRGINSDELVGYTEGLPIIQRIRDVHGTRDRKAGHGYRPKGVAPITYRELMNAQALARACILSQLDHLGAFAAQDELVRRSSDEWERPERMKAL